jgi:hypothetical protein
MGHGDLLPQHGGGAFFKTLKSELVWRTVFETRHEAKQAISRYIDGFYTLSGATPRSKSQARPSSREWLPIDPTPPHPTKASPGDTRRDRQASHHVADDGSPCQSRSHNGG